MMESIHGVDVSWMSKHSSNNAKDHGSRPQATRTSTSPTRDHEATAAPNGNGNGNDNDNDNGNGNGNGHHEPTPPKPIPAHRPSFSRSQSTDKTATLNGSLPKSGSPSPGLRRNSWLSSFSSKFSSSPGTHNHTQPASPPASASPQSLDSPTIPTGPQHPKNAVLPQGVKATGDSPYIPAPPKSPQPGFFQSALRRLSSSGGQLSAPGKGLHHGLCERKVLNVDRNRERCHISELDQSKLRRVAFCVDVEIASGPRYVDEEADDEKRREPKGSRKLAVAEKNEAVALKNPEAIQIDKETDGVMKATSGDLPTDSKEPSEITVETKDESLASEKDLTKKKEKKKRSEEERKARKEKKRKMAEANGTVPVELVRNPSDSSLGSIPAVPQPTQASPTTDPVRIYRRCCQLRETPILKKITEQLSASMTNGHAGIVCKLDLTGYWLQLPDLITLGDYLAVVPVKELVMENSGLTDEGVRVILAGLLAAKRPDWERRRYKKGKSGEVPQGGFVERVVFKHNVKIGRDGWRYISTFIAMCRSLKSMDLSKVPFPQTPPPAPSPHSIHGFSHLSRTSTTSSTPDISCVLGKAIGERLAGREFELLNVAECGISTDQLGSLVDGIIKSGLRRLGVAGNGITTEGMQHIARYIRDGKCEGLDLGGNDLKHQLGVIADALDSSNNLYALSIADCNLTPDSLWALFPALSKLSNFRFIDLSQNHGLFEAEPSALSLLRRYLPKMPSLKRIHLTDVAMSSEQAIALAEILPESPNLAHVNMLENPGLAALANAKDESNQEEACALYASLMAAVRVSQSIICVDIEVPSPNSSEVVKALAKQVVAYCLWNMERGPVAEISEAAAAIADPHGGEKEVAVPDVLLHLVGHVEGLDSLTDDDEPAPDEDYVIGGTGVVKALGICLRNKGNDAQRLPIDRTYSEGGSGSATPRTPVPSGKAKDMSKNLLGSARKIRDRLQPALVKESRSGDRNSYQRLLFLDKTLEGMIKRFEEEFPDTRLPTTVTSPSIPDVRRVSPASSFEQAVDGHISDIEPAFIEAPHSDDEDGLRPMLSRHNSDVSLASRALSQEEGRMHRFGQQFRRDILKPDIEDLVDYAHGNTANEPQPAHLKMLRAMVEGLGGEEIKNKIIDQGPDAVIEELSNEASALRQELKEQDPESWTKFVESQEAAIRNQKLAGLERHVSVID